MGNVRKNVNCNAKMIPELSLRYSSNRLRDKRRGRAKVDRTREEEKGKKNKEEGEERRWGGKSGRERAGGRRNKRERGREHEESEARRPGGGRPIGNYFFIFEN